MNTTVTTTVLLVSVAASDLDDQTANLVVEDLRCEYRLNPAGIDVLRPRLEIQEDQTGIHPSELEVREPVQRHR